MSTSPAANEYNQILQEILTGLRVHHESILESKREVLGYWVQYKNDKRSLVEYYRSRSGDFFWSQFQYRVLDLANDYCRIKRIHNNLMEKFKDPELKKLRNRLQNLLLKNPASKTGVTMQHRLEMCKKLSELIGGSPYADTSPAAAFETSVKTDCKLLFKNLGTPNVVTLFGLKWRAYHPYETSDNFVSGMRWFFSKQQDSDITRDFTHDWVAYLSWRKARSKKL